MRCISYLSGLLLLLLVACNPGPSEQSQSNSKNVVQSKDVQLICPVARNFNAEYVDVKALDDPQNPFIGQYSAMDQWSYDHWINTEYKRLGEPGVYQGMLDVTDEGFLVPELTQLRNNLELSQGNDIDEPQCQHTYTLYSEGEISDELMDEILQARAVLTAQYMPSIPQWLAEQPPYWAQLLPDGSVVTYGQLGTGGEFYSKDGRWRQELQPPACHFSADGESLEQLEYPHLWVEFFFPDFDGALELHQITRDKVQVYNRYVVFQNFDESSKSGMYLYDGTPITSQEWDSLTDANRYFEMYGKHIMAMYEAQQLTSD